MNTFIARLHCARSLAILASLTLAASPAQGATITLDTLSESIMVGLNDTNPAKPNILYLVADDLGLTA